MWKRVNPNPAHKNVGDCVVRAISIAMRRPWVEVYDDICQIGREEYDMPNSDAVWGLY